VVKHAFSLGVLSISTVALADTKLVPDDLPGPPPEVVKNAAKVDPPAVPAFELPAVEPGFHTPRELRVRGNRLLGTELKVKGYITWIYDCPTAIASVNPKATRAQIRTAIDKDPTLCERPKFYLGDAKDTPREAAIWVVEVPRPPNKPERDRLPKDQLKGWPAVPKLALGDYVAVTGAWALESPHAERNSEGLLVFKAIEPSTPAASTGAAPVPPPPEPDIAVVSKPPMRKPVDDKVRNASAAKFNTCNRALAARQLDTAITECEAATKLWDGNHLAWYARATAHMTKSEWPLARTAMERAVTQRPDLGMYQLYHGIALYEAEQRRAREEQARKDGKKPEDVTVEPSQLKLDPARDALRRAVKLAPDLWRAHYYLGRVYRDLDDSRRAAEQFTETIRTHPGYRFAYIALCELYLRWSYVDQALAVALLGTTSVPPAEARDLWFLAGRAYDEKLADDPAIDAFTKVLASNPDDVKAKFQRGQVYVRKGDVANAKADFEDIMKSADPQVAGLKPFARSALEKMSAKKR
jgi:tetratricopeptide (TPR) repeat protein